MTNEEIHKVVERNKKIKEKKTNQDMILLNQIAPILENYVEKNKKLEEFNQRKERAKAKEENLYNFQEDQHSFEISDDEDLNQKASARDRLNQKNKRLNDEIRADEDFKRIGDAIIGESEMKKKSFLQSKKNRQEHLWQHVWRIFQ